MFLWDLSLLTASTLRTLLSSARNSARMTVLRASTSTNLQPKYVRLVLAGKSLPAIFPMLVKEPSGYEGVVRKTERFNRRGAGTEEQKKELAIQIKEYEKQMRARECVIFRQMIDAIHKKFEVNIVDLSTRQKVGASADDEVIYEQIESFNIKWIKPASLRDNAQKIVDRFWAKISEIQEEKSHRIEVMKHGDELPSGVLQMVKIYVAIKRSLSIGDKMAGRHGNKGVIAKIMPEEDMQ